MLRSHAPSFRLQIAPSCIRAYAYALSSLWNISVGTPLTPLSTGSPHDPHPGLAIPSLYFSKALLLPFHALTAVCHHAFNRMVSSLGSTFSIQLRVPQRRDLAAWFTTVLDYSILQVQAWTRHWSGGYQENKPPPVFPTEGLSRRGNGCAGDRGAESPTDDAELFHSNSGSCSQVQTGTPKGAGYITRVQGTIWQEMQWPSIHRH